MKKGIISFLIVICLLTVQVDTYAEAGSLIVAGGSVATGGLAGAALAGLSGPVVVAVFLGLMAFGFNVELTKQSEQAGLTKTEFVKNKIQEYCNEVNISVGVFNQYILEEMEVFNDGRIKLGDKAASQIKKFGNWLVESEQVLNPDSSDGFTSGDVDLTKMEIGQLYRVNSGTATETQLYLKSASTDNDLYLVRTNNTSTTYEVVGLSRVRGTYFRFSMETSESINGNALGRATSTSIGNGWYSTVIGTTGTAGICDIAIFDGDRTDLSRALADEITAGGGDATEDSFTGDKDDWASGNHALDPEADKSTVLDPGITGTVPVPADKDYTWDVNSYLDALEKLLDKIGNPPADPAVDSPAVDDATGLPVDISIPVPTVLDPDIDKVPDEDLPSENERTPVVDPDQLPTDENLALDPLKFDLKNIFPFCLPWDIKDMINLLASDPVAPSYHVKWHVPFADNYLEFDVDLSGYNDTAALLRKMEILVFCIGLAYVTRSMFIRS